MGNEIGKWVLIFWGGNGEEGNRGKWLKGKNTEMGVIVSGEMRSEGRKQGKMVKKEYKQGNGLQFLRGNGKEVNREKW